MNTSQTPPGGFIKKNNFPIKKCESTTNYTLKTFNFVNKNGNMSNKENECKENIKPGEKIKIERRRTNTVHVSTNIFMEKTAFVLLNIYN